MTDADSPTLPDPGGRNLVRLAAVIHVVLGLGFGFGTVVTLWHLGRTGELPMTPWGFRSLDGPFVQLGTERLTFLGWGLVVTCTLDVLAGRWLWQGRRRGARLGLVTSPFAVVLGAGFALPFLLIGVPIRLALAAAGRRSLA